MERKKAVLNYLENKHVELANETISVDNLSDSSENETLSEWSAKFSVTTSTLVGTRVSGNITEDTFWSAENSPYIVSGNLEVLQDVTLTIEAGSVITMKKQRHQVVLLLLRVVLMPKEQPVAQ